MQLKSSYHDIWKVSYPVILGGISQTIIHVTDTIFLGRVGEIELGASVIGGIFFIVLFMIGLGFSNGLQILIARKSGEKKENEIGEIFLHGAIIISVLTFCLFIILFFLSKPFLTLVIQDARILEATIKFLDYRSFGICFVSVCLLFRALYIGLGKTISITMSMAIMAIVNVILNYLLVFGNYGFPKMGISGSALASSLAELSGAAFFIFYAVRNKNTRQLKIFNFTFINKSTLLRILNLSFPIVMQLLLSLGGWFVFFLVIEKTGERNLAISNITRSVLFVLMTPVWGFFAAANSMTSNLIGQNKNDEVIPLVKKICALSFAVTLIPTLLVFIFPFATLKIFTNDASLIEDSLYSLYMICGASIMFSISGILLGAVTGTGRTKEALIIETITIVSYFLYLYYIAYRVHASIAILWTTEIFYWLIAGTISLYYLAGKKWEGKII